MTDASCTPDPTPGDGLVIVTGAGGEMGHALVPWLLRQGKRVVAMDLRPPPTPWPDGVVAATGDVRDRSFVASMADLHGDRPVEAVFHLAAVLSTAAERNPELAHEVNVLGTMNLLSLAAERGTPDRPPLFLLPSSIAVYGFDSLEAKRAAGPIDEDGHLAARTIYGLGKLAAEELGRYYATFFRQLDVGGARSAVDFRSIRFPGILSADTVPSGGTSDYGPEMLHAAAKGEIYRCFVRPDSRIPFMTMPDAIRAIEALAAAPAAALSRRVYNVGAFAPSAEEIAGFVATHLPEARIDYAPDAARQAIVDSWPEAVDDGAARRDWGWSPRHDAAGAFAEYLAPRVIARYATTTS
ncbi:MAG: NAD-dependent epimerase/dehydratase family protein [Planctomycetota bacterium]|nr:NAD-dependent epimerase/dehydratase family protein [Planctomycetota bacterium]